MLRRFVRWNQRVSHALDRLLPADFSIDGNSNFPPIVRRFVKPGMSVVDIGGGRGPFFSVAEKRARSLHVTGVDISAEELNAAPAGAYDRTVCADIAEARGDESADLCVCRAVLEHVSDTESAIRAIASFLKPGGLALIFVPSRNAVFARLNLLLPESVKRAILFTVYPHTRTHQGFRSYYRHCTPRALKRIAGDAGLTEVEFHPYFVSSYFMAFAPIHALWRVWMLVFRAIAHGHAAETFSFVFVKGHDFSASGAQQFDRVPHEG